MSPHVKVLDPSDPASLQLCRQIFEAALEADFRDDRLGVGVGEICLVAFDGDNPVGFCMGTPGSGPTVDLDLVVVAGHEIVAKSLWETAVNAAVETSDATPQLWGRPAQQYHDELAAEFQLSPSRELYQMRAPLPIGVEPVATSGFRPGVDDAAWIEVNNASFARHPDQGTYTQSDLEKRMSEPWFDADGFRLFFDDDQIAGFCWTKIHRRAPLVDLGEIYVIGLAPATTDRAWAFR